MPPRAAPGTGALRETEARRVEREGELQPPEGLAPAPAGELHLAADHEAHDLAPERHPGSEGGADGIGRRRRIVGGGRAAEQVPDALGAPSASASSSTAVRAATMRCRSPGRRRLPHASPSLPPAASVAGEHGVLDLVGDLALERPGALEHVPEWAGERAIDPSVTTSAASEAR
jgi:hypothetical protein